MKRKNGFSRRLLPLAGVLLCASLFYSLVRSQMSITAKEQELAGVQATAAEPGGDAQLQLVSAEGTTSRHLLLALDRSWPSSGTQLQRTLDDGEDAIIERIAREQGYAKPNERIWVDISGK